MSFEICEALALRRDCECWLAHDFLLELRVFRRELRTEGAIELRFFLRDECCDDTIECRLAGRGSGAIPAAAPAARLVREAELRTRVRVCIAGS